MEFSKKLKALRAEKGISQERLAEAIHISRSAVAKWEAGLGLPNDASMTLLAAYFGVGVPELVGSKESEETLVKKNKTIARQKKIIIALLIGIGTGIFFYLMLTFAELQPMMGPLGIGILAVVFGVFNMRGNIASIHWYNRRKVKPEDQPAYCRVMGLGTLLVGVGMILSGILQVLSRPETGAVFSLTGVLVGCSLMLYAQFKYNKGIF